MWLTLVLPNGLSPCRTNLFDGRSDRKSMKQRQTRNNDSDRVQGYSLVSVGRVIEPVTIELNSQQFCEFIISYLRENESVIEQLNEYNRINQN